jgi:hypothetical protein
MSETHDVVASFVDGEPVDPGRLAAALAEADGRTYLIDLLALRGLVRGDAGVRPARSGARSGRPAARWWTTAAAVVLTGAVAGYAAGVRVGSGGPAGELTARRASQAGLSVPAPPPTSVIRLEPGVDWEERTGGN